MRNQGWFRFYDRMIDSPQVLELSDSEFRLLTSLWCLASAQGETGEIPFTTRALQRRAMPTHTLESVQEMLDHLITLDLLVATENGYMIPRWEQHQYTYKSWSPEARREQKREERKRNKEVSQACRKRVARSRKTDTDTDTESKKKNDSHSSLAAADADGVAGGAQPLALPLAADTLVDPVSALSEAPERTRRAKMTTVAPTPPDVTAPPAPPAAPASAEAPRPKRELSDDKRYRIALLEALHAANGGPTEAHEVEWAAAGRCFKWEGGAVPVETVIECFQLTQRMPQYDTRQLHLSQLTGGETHLRAYLRSGSASYRAAVERKRRAASETLRLMAATATASTSRAERGRSLHGPTGRGSDADWFGETAVASTSAGGGTF